MNESQFDLKTELKAIGMNQREFANYTEVNENTVSRWVRGELPMPKWVELLVFNYKKVKLLDEIVFQYKLNI